MATFKQQGSHDHHRLILKQEPLRYFMACQHPRYDLSSIGSTCLQRHTSGQEVVSRAASVPARL